ncbi:MAG: hypothetical protein LQ350_002248 [Teloschistes chrysophthalmus]|nr:MAG: hypothetical protein LQ350_002248 [Niorma chrysophthalma]
MPLNFSAAHSSRITKRTSKLPSLRRSATSPFASFNQRKPIQRSKSKPEFPHHDDEDLFDERLNDLGLVTTLATDHTFNGVVEIVEYATSHMFDPLPERGGFNSVRIAEILNFRQSLPKLVTVAHVHALSKSPTATEKEISDLIKANILRKISIPGRGTGRSTIGEALVLLKDLEEMLSRAEAISDALKGRFMTYLRTHPYTSPISPTFFSLTDLHSLKRAGFLTLASQPFNSTPHSSNIPQTPSTSIPTISRAASGSLAAVGGSGAVIEAGGTLGLRRESSSAASTATTADLQLSLPNTGPYLRLLSTARAHLVALVQKSHFRETPVYLLRERWDGGVVSEVGAGREKRARGEFAGVLPARTRKWRMCWGMRFEWVLEEAVGGGGVELFETGSVGRGVRMTS